MNTTTTIVENKEYLYVITGVIPEVMPFVVYRREGKSELAGRKLLKCPHCTEYLTDVDRNSRVRLYRKPKNKPIKAVPGQYIKKCSVCKNEVGIVMI